jgi:hypothetical protein
VPLALRPSEGAADLTVRNNGQVKALGCLFYVDTGRCGQDVHLVWNTTQVEIFSHDGEHIVSYPRPSTTGVYYGPRTPTGTPMKGVDQNPSAATTGTAVRTVSKGGYVGALASKFYASYKRKGEQVTITWNATTVTLTDATGATVATYDKPAQPRGWHGPTRPPSTKS